MSRPVPSHRFAAPRIAVLCLLVVTASALGAAPAFSATDTDGTPSDEVETGQVIDSGQAIATEPTTIASGHVDIGPRFVDGEWTLLIHDDTAKADATSPSVWRYPDLTVLSVADAAILEVPDDPAYDFLGQEPGTPVHVVQQTQHPDVVWVGWNTQDPEVMATIDRGVTLSLAAVDGPGDLVVYLQSGNFGAPTQLWDSREPGVQQVWVDVNTHTHANWVFTEPGVYLAQFQIAADLIDGSTATTTETIRFAVGDETNAADALAADALALPSDAPVEAVVVDAPADPLVGVLIAAIVLVALAMVGAVIWVVVRGNAVKRRALSERTAP